MIQLLHDGMYLVNGEQIVSKKEAVAMNLPVPEN